MESHNHNHNSLNEKKAMIDSQVLQITAEFLQKLFDTSGVQFDNFFVDIKCYPKMMESWNRDFAYTSIFSSTKYWESVQYMKEKSQLMPHDFTEVHKNHSVVVKIIKSMYPNDNGEVTYKYNKEFAELLTHH